MRTAEGIPRHVVSVGLVLLVLMAPLMALGAPSPAEPAEDVETTGAPAPVTGLHWVHGQLDVEAGVAAIRLNMTARVWIHGWHTDATLDWRHRSVDQFAMFQGIQFGGPAALGWTAFWGDQDLVVSGVAADQRIDASVRTSSAGLWGLTSNTWVSFPLPAGAHHFVFAAPDARSVVVDVWLLVEDASVVAFDDDTPITSEEARVFDLSGMEEPTTSQSAVAARVAAVGDAQAGRLAKATTQGTGRHFADWHVEPGVGTYSLRTVGAESDISEARAEASPFADRYAGRVDGAAATATTPFVVELRHGAQVTLYDHGFRFITFAIDIP